LAAKTILLQATQFSSENWFPAGYTIQQRKLIRCTQFGSENYFAVGTTQFGSES
jgi:hypothetical protein